MFVNDKKVGEGRIAKTVPARYSQDETFDVGLDTGLPVSNDYASPNSFTGMTKKVEIHLEPVTMNRTDIEQIQKVEEASDLAAQ
jgi:hypothetical protein